MQLFGGVWGDVAGSIGVLAGLVSLACLVVRIDRQRSVGPRAKAESVMLGRAREWELVMRRAMQDLSRAAELPALQASAAVKIESAEHALDRLVADCAMLCRMPSALPARDPVPFRGRYEAPSRAPEQRLAA